MRSELSEMSDTENENVYSEPVYVQVHSSSQNQFVSIETEDEMPELEPQISYQENLL